MPLLAPLAPLFEALNAPGERLPAQTVEEARAKAHAALERHILSTYPQPDPLPREEDLFVPVPGAEIRIRIYAPTVTREPLPCHVYFHGGGFWLGTIDHFDPLSRGLACEADCIVASVDYRLAPEHKFPTAPEDGYAALAWLVANAHEVGLDPERVSVGGMSAGGNLAAVLALMARDRGGPRLVQQVLEVPIADLTNLEPLCIAEEGLELSADKQVYIRHYLADPRVACEPYVSPLLDPDLSGLPPALILCAEYDPLILDGRAYAARLTEAGVPVEFHVCQGQFHGAQQMATLIPDEAAAYQTRIATVLRRAYHQTCTDMAQASGGPLT